MVTRSRFGLGLFTLFILTVLYGMVLGSPMYGQAGDQKDGFDQLPLAEQAYSMGGLLHSGRLARPLAPPTKFQYFTGQRPTNSAISWSPAVEMSAAGSRQPAAALHPINPLLALSGGPSNEGAQINRTTDGGLSWQWGAAPQPSVNGDGVVTWLREAHTALFANLNPAPGGATLLFSRTTDSGATWQPINSSGFSGGGVNDREYLWTDHNPASPHYGRVYLTETFGSQGLQSMGSSQPQSGYFTVGVRWSDDNGLQWSPLVPLADPQELAHGIAVNQFASLAVEPNGAAVVAWQRGKCCGDHPSITGTNQIRWARTNDGGVSFPLSGTIAEIPDDQAVPFNSTSPGGFRWSSAPNIAADPLDGRLYAVWVQYRTPGDPQSAAIYAARAAADGQHWEALGPIYRNPDLHLFQYMPWVQVSARAVQVTFSGAVQGNSWVLPFYVESTNGGMAWTPPFPLSDYQAPPAPYMGDYASSSVGGGENTLLTTWTDTVAGQRQWGRVGASIADMVTPTATTVTSSPSPSETLTVTASPTPTATTLLCVASGLTNGDFESGAFSGWTVATSGSPWFPAPPVVTTWTAHSGNHALQVGQITGHEGYGVSGITQEIAIPPTGGTLSLWYWTYSAETLEGDSQEIALLRGGRVVASLLHTWENGMTWQALNVDVSPWRGETLILRVLVNQDNGGDNTALLIDDVQLLQPCIPIGCGGGFSDVPPTNTFWPFIARLACAGVLNGYNDGTFRPNGAVTRAQFAKLVVNAAHFVPPQVGHQTFADVLPSNTFHSFIEAAASRQLISGYSCGSAPAEPCDGESRPYYRPSLGLTRGQAAKMLTLAVGNPFPPTAGHTFADVLPSNTFHSFIEAAASRQLISGYSCGSAPAEPCDGESRPYYRPSLGLTRGQAAKIVQLGLLP